MSARPPTRGETAAIRTPRSRAASSRSRIPGTARIGPIETNGLEGQSTIASAALSAAATSGVGRGLLDAAEGDLEDVRRLVEAHEVVLEGEPAGGRPDARADRLVRHRQDGRGHAEGVLDPAVDLREADPLPEPPRPVHVQGEVAVAEAEPGRLAQPLQHRGRGPCLPGQAPAALAVGEAGQGVEHGVVVGADEEAAELRVVGRVDHDGQLSRCQDVLEPVGEPGPADPAGQGDDARHRRAPQPASAARTSPIRAIVSASYGAGRRTTIVAKPRST